MKKVKLTNRLSLNKETVAKLNNDQLNGVQGGSQSAHSCVTVCQHTCVGYDCTILNPTIVGATCDCTTTPGYNC